MYSMQFRRFWFALKASAMLPIYVSPVPDPMAWKQDAFSYHGTISAPMPSPLLAGIVESDALEKALLDSSSSILASKGVVHLSVVSSGGRTSQAPLAVESPGSAPHQEVPSWHGTYLASLPKGWLCKRS